MASLYGCFFHQTLKFVLREVIGNCGNLSLTDKKLLFARRPVLDAARVKFQLRWNRAGQVVIPAETKLQIYHHAFVAATVALSAQRILRGASISAEARPLIGSTGKTAVCLRLDWSRCSAH